MSAQAPESAAVLHDAAGLPLTLGAAVVLRGVVTTLWLDLARLNVIVEVADGQPETEQRHSEFALHAHRLRQQQSLGAWTADDAEWRDGLTVLANQIGLDTAETQRLAQFIEDLLGRVSANAILLRDA